MGKNMFVTRDVPHSSICLVTPISRERSLMKWADVASLCTLFPHLQMPFARWFKSERSFQTRQLIKACRQLFHKNTFSSQTILHMVGNMNSTCCRISDLLVIGRISSKMIMCPFFFAHNELLFQITAWCSSQPLVSTSCSRTSWRRWWLLLITEAPEQLLKSMTFVYYTSPWKGEVWRYVSSLNYTRLNKIYAEFWMQLKMLLFSAACLLAGVSVAQVS